jgi:predicted RNase H-like HicB family nuclease
MKNVPFIKAEWDNEANVWVATSNDVPGLATEADTFDALSIKLKALVPELLELNGETVATPVPFELSTHKFAQPQQMVH